MVSDLAIVIQGESKYVELLKSAFKGYNTIFSTWEGEESKYSSDDKVIYNSLPRGEFGEYIFGPCNLNLQKISTINGLLLAKQLGFKKALKIRSDLIPNNASEFLNLLNNDHLNFLCWHGHEVYPNCSGYLVDFLMSGNIDDLLNIWDIEDMSWCVVPEIFLTSNVINKYKDINNINYILNNITEINDLFWIKNNKNLSSFNKQWIYSLTKEHLKPDYLKFL